MVPIIRRITTHFLLLAILASAGCTSGLEKSVRKTDPGADLELAKGIAAFGKGNYDDSRKFFNEIIENRAGSSEVQEAQWYLAQIAEKRENLVEAKQQYSFFIKNFPSSAHVSEAKKILAALEERTSAPAPIKFPKPRRTGGRYGKISGAFTTDYSYDVLIDPKPTLTTQNRLSEYLDFRWKSTAGPDLKVYFSGLYTHDFEIQRYTRSRISKVFLEWNDSSSTYSVRFGRQPSSGNTLFSRFDGVSLGYRLSDAFYLTASGGYPVDTFQSGGLKIQLDQSFYEAYLSVYDYHGVGGKIYYTQEFFEGFSTRNAVGSNGFWMKDPLNVSFAFDYDLDFNKFNDRAINIEYTRSIVRYSLGVESRKNPFLDYRTALFEPTLFLQTPPVTSFDVLKQILSREEIRSMALSNTSDSMEYRLGTEVDFSQVWRADFRYTYGEDKVIDFLNGKIRKHSDRFSIFLMERNGLRLSEVWSILFLEQISTDYQTTTATTTLSKYWKNMTLGTLRCRLEQYDFKTSGVTLSRFVPGFSISFYVMREIYTSIEADYAMEKNSTSQGTLNTLQTRISVNVPF